MFITNNFLDRGFQNMLLPFQFMQHMFFLSRFSIEHNCIRIPSVNNYILSLIATVVFSVFHSVTLVITEGFDGFSMIVKFFNKLNVIIVVITYLIFYYNNFTKRKNIIEMVLKIQRVLRIIYYKRYKMLTIWNWISVSLHCVLYFLIVLVTRDLSLSFFFYSLFYLNTETIYAIRMIDLIRDGMKTWIAEVKYYGKLCLELEEEKYNNNLKKLSQAYIDLMEAFDILKDISKFSVRVTFTHHCMWFIIFNIEKR